MRTFFTLGLLVLLGGAHSAQDAPAGREALARDERTLRQAGVPTDGPGLIAFFRQHTTSAGDVGMMEKLVEQLGHDSFQAREQASARLVAVGDKAAPFLKKAKASPDFEVAYRAAKCLEQIAHGSSADLLGAAARVLADRKPDGAVEALLGYVPFAESPHLRGQLVDALAPLATRGGKAEPVLEKALADADPHRRAAAGVALLRGGPDDVRPAVRKLLDDPKPAVRSHVGLALAAAGEKEAVPVLIKLLADLPAEETGRIEEMLYRLAEDQAPVGAGLPRPYRPGDTPESRKKYRDAWRDWYAKNKDKIDGERLAKAARLLGHTLVVHLDAGEVAELDANNKPLWKIGGLAFPLDAQLLPNGNVLIAEHRAGQVTERNHKGEVVWRKEVPEPLAAQRLPDGNTFIATRTRLMEVDRDGKEVRGHAPPRGGEVMKAARLPNGDIACVTKLGVSRFFQIDKDGKEVRSFGVQLDTSGGRIDVLRNGHVLIPEMSTNRIVEHDTNGRPVWEVTFEKPINATRLPNGNTLVTSYNMPRAVELNRAGKEVWEYNTNTRVTRAFRH